MGPRGRRARRRGLIVGAAVGSAAARRSNDNAQQDQPAQSAAQDDKISQLEKLAELKEKGILTDAEFEQQKAAILGQ